jgi:REP element-mobilizing transposase RayT
MDACSRSRPTLRYGRFGGRGTIYFVTTVTEGRRRHFLEPEVARAVCRALLAPETWPGASLIAWVLMPDHWHGLVRLHGDTDLSTSVATFKWRTARAASLAIDASAELWAASFHRMALRRDAELLGMARYLLGNPVRARLVANVRDYPYWHGAWRDGA